MFRYNYTKSDLINLIDKLGENGQYNNQATHFLALTNSKIKILEAVPQKSPLWVKEGENHGIHYSIKIWKLGTNKEYTFDYWDSIANKEAGKRPKNYDVLACLDIFEGDFEDFCSSFGYSGDSIIALKTYKAVMKQTKELKNLYTPEELEALQFIN